MLQTILLRYEECVKYITFTYAVIKYTTKNKQFLRLPKTERFSMFSFVLQIHVKRRGCCI